MIVLGTARLVLEPMSHDHLDGLHAMNGDAEVMRFITGHGQTRDETAAMIDTVIERWARFGFSWWSFLERDTGEVVGAGCVQHLGRDPANPYETGWRLRRDRWGRGYATEAAREMARFAFEDLGAPLLCAVCHPDNRASWHVMEKIGMVEGPPGRWYDMDCRYFDVDAARWRAARER